MLPACRTAGEGFAIPTFDLTPSDVEEFIEELWEFQSTFHDCFACSEPRVHFFDYMVGQLSPLERKSIEPMPSKSRGARFGGCRGSSVMCAGMRSRCSGTTISSWPRRWASQMACSCSMRWALSKMDKTYYSYISNAPVSTPLRTLVWLSSLRWAIEQCFEEAKTELGMAHYEVRKYPGWQHHMLTTMLAHFFLWHLKLCLGEKSPALTASQLRMLLDAV